VCKNIYLDFFSIWCDLLNHENRYKILANNMTNNINNIIKMMKLNIIFVLIINNIILVYIYNSWMTLLMHMHGLVGKSTSIYNVKFLMYTTRKASISDRIQPTYMSVGNVVIFDKLWYVGNMNCFPWNFNKFFKNYLGRNFSDGWISLKKVSITNE